LQALKLDAHGAVVQGRFGNGVTESFERDAIGQPSTFASSARRGRRFTT